jgi:lipopolysaccharide export system permease protein
MKTLDSYILRQVIATFVFGVLAICVIFVVVHLLENLDSFLDKKLPLVIILRFYVNFLPEIIKLITPVAMLLAALFTVGRLSNTNEIIAMKSGGMSVYRIMIPVVLFGVALSIGQVWFNGWVVPKANGVKAEIERRFMQKGRIETSLYNVYLRDAPTRNVMIRFYDDITKIGNFISIEEYSSEESPRLLSRIDAQTFTFDTISNAWKLMQAMEHRFGKTPAGTDTMTARVVNEYLAHLSIKPRELFQLQRGTDELTFEELREYITLSQRGGKDVRQQMIDYYGQYALPFANAIVTLFGIVPLAAAGTRKRGLAMELASAMIIAFLYMVFVKIGQSLALASPLPPMIGAWMANGVFLVIGLALALKLRS